MAVTVFIVPNWLSEEIGLDGSINVFDDPVDCLMPWRPDGLCVMFEGFIPPKFEFTTGGLYWPSW